MRRGQDRLARVFDRYVIGHTRGGDVPETSIERLMRQALELLQVEHAEQGRVGPYWPDFIIKVSGKEAVIECDGPHHLTKKQQRKDRKKDAVYALHRLPVFRFTDVEIRRSAVGCVQQVLDAIREQA